MNKNPSASPVRFFIILILSILITEICIMFLFIYIHLDPVAEIFIDTFMLIAIISPVLFFFSFRPLISQIKRTEQAKQELVLSQNKLRQKTTDLVQKTKLLERKNKEADEKGIAILNILEDLDQEKNDLKKINVEKEAFLQSIGEGLIVTDQDGKVIMASKTALELIGYSPDQLYGKVWAKDIPLVEDELGKQIPYEKTPVYGALHNKGTSTTKFFYKIKSGRSFPVLVTAAPVILEGKNQGTVVVFRDITKEEEVDRAKSEFISLASHQLRTPLSAIKWFTELLGDTKITKEQAEFMDNISKSTERMIELVNSLLNISRIESGRIAVNPQPTNLARLVEDSISNMQQDIDAKALQLIITADPDLPEVRVDQKMIRIVYENLLTNAIKYTPESGKLSVSIQRQGEEVISKVADTGLGIPRKDYGRIFSKFYRGDNVIKVESEGTGLGLYLAKAIINSSKGKIGFESTEGKGTTFWFSLPLSGTPAKEGKVTLT